MTIQTKPVGYLELLRQNADFRNLWLGQVISLMGDWFNLIATATLVASLTSSGLAVGGLFVVRGLAQFLSSPFGGVLADRFNRKSIMIWADFLRAAIVLGFLLIKEPGQVWLLYTLTALQLTISGVFAPTKDSILPDLVSNREIGTANAINATTWSTMLAFGAALGGMVAGQWGIGPAIIIDSLSFLLSAYFIWRIQYVQTTDPTGTKFTPLDAFRQYFIGAGYLARHRDILILAVQKASMVLAVSSIFDIIQVELSNTIFVYGEGGSTSLGWLFAMVGIGTGVSPIIARYFTGDRDRPLRHAITIGYIFAGAGLLIVSTLASFGVVLFGTFIRGFGVAIVWVFSTTILLQRLPNAVRGRVFGTEYAIFTLCGAVGSATGGWIFDTFGISIPAMLWGMTAAVAALGTLWVTAGVVGSRPPAPDLAAAD